MIRVLHIDCCIRRHLSRTKILADNFLDALLSQSGYIIDTLCLMDEPLTYLSEGFFEQRENLLKAGQLDHPRFRYAHQFKRADKIIISAPFWDLSFPALLKVYLENVCVDGLTFKCDLTGCHGTCNADRLLFLTTRGGDLRKSSLEQGTKYLKAICGFLGINRFDFIAADGLDLGLEMPEQILERAIKKAKRIALKF